MTDSPSRPPRSQESDPEIVLAQALRAMAGGRSTPSVQGSTTEPGRTRLSTTQILLIAAIVGLLVGVAAALVQLAG